MFSWSSSSSTNDDQTDSASAWRSQKESGKTHFQSQNYTLALESYRNALDSSPPSSEHPILLSNVVACRLKLAEGDDDDTGLEMLSTAVEEAKVVVRLNDQWAKGHVRLASAYIALGEWEARNNTSTTNTNNRYSNDACNALQKALQIDPSYTLARKMLVKELRRRNDPNYGRNVRGEDYTNRGAVPSAPPQPDGDEGEERGFDVNIEEDDRPQTSNDTNDDSDDTQYDIDPVDDGLPLHERINIFRRKITRWYTNSLSDESKMLFKVFLFMTFLYVALGGRFGLDYALSGGRNGRSMGNYGEGNAYDKYRNRRSGNTGRYETRYRDDDYDSYNYGSASTSHRRQQQDPHHSSSSRNSHDQYYDTSYSSSGYSSSSSNRRRNRNRGGISSWFNTHSFSPWSMEECLPMVVIASIIFFLNFNANGRRNGRRVNDGGYLHPNNNRGWGGARVHFGGIAQAILFGMLRGMRYRHGRPRRYRW